jgi:hypothetical protein
MISWLYRYVLRGWSILLIAWIITSLWIGWQAIRTQTQHSAEKAVTAPKAATPPAGAPTGARR